MASVARLPLEWIAGDVVAVHEHLLVAVQAVTENRVGMRPSGRVAPPMSEAWRHASRSLSGAQQRGAYGVVRAAAVVAVASGLTRAALSIPVCDGARQRTSPEAYTAVLHALPRECRVIDICVVADRAGPGNVLVRAAVMAVVWPRVGKGLTQVVYLKPARKGCSPAFCRLAC